MCCDATDVRLEPLPAESSVYMGNGWFGYAVMLWVITMITYVCLHRVLVESSVHMDIQSENAGSCMVVLP